MLTENLIPRLIEDTPDAWLALAEEATLEAIAAERLFTICQGCVWPILHGERRYFVHAAEGYICQSCCDAYRAPALSA